MGPPPGQSHEIHHGDLVPALALERPIDLPTRPAPADFDPTVRLLYRFIVVTVLGHASHDPIVHEGLHVFLKRTMIAFEGQHIMAAPVDDLPGGALLAADGVDRDGRIPELQHLQQRRDGGDLVGLVVDFQLAEHGVVLMDIGVNHVDRRLARSTIKAAA